MNLNIVVNCITVSKYLLPLVEGGLCIPFH